MLDVDESNLVHYALSKLPFIMPNLEFLSLCSAGEMFSTPLLAVKLLYLKNLQIFLDDGQMGGFSPAYDYPLAFNYDIWSLHVVEPFNSSVRVVPMDAGITDSSKA